MSCPIVAYTTHVHCCDNQGERPLAKSILSSFIMTLSPAARDSVTVSLSLDARQTRLRSVSFALYWHLALTADSSNELAEQPSVHAPGACFRTVVTAGAAATSGSNCPRLAVDARP